MAGVYTDQRLNLSNRWEGPQKTCRGFKPDPGNLAVRDYRGASGIVKPWWDCEPVLQSKEQERKPLTYSGARPISIPIQDSEAYRQGLPWGDYESPGRNESERASGLENEWIRGPSLQLKGEGSMGCRNLTDAASPPWRGESDSTVTRTYRVTGEALLVPVRNHRSRVDRITGSTGKSIDDERVADGSV